MQRKSIMIEFINNKTNIGRLPLLVADNNEIVIYKNDAYARLNKTRIGGKLEKIFSNKIMEIIRITISQSEFDIIEFNEFADCCAICILPNGNETVFVFLPHHFEKALNKGKSGIIDFIWHQLCSEQINDKLGDSLTRIRQTINKNLINEENNQTHRIEFVKIVELITKQFKLCAAPLGVYLKASKDIPNVYIRTSINSFAAEILCLFDIAISLSSNNIIEVKTFTDFNKINFSFGCQTEFEDLDESMYIEKYVLHKLTEKTSHYWDIILENGSVTCNISIPIDNNPEFSANEQETVIKLLSDALQF